MISLILYTEPIKLSILHNFTCDLLSKKKDKIPHFDVLLRGGIGGCLTFIFLNKKYLPG